MFALITGGTSGIGKEIAFQLSKLGYDLILVSRTTNDLDEILPKVKTKVLFFSFDLSKTEECEALLKKTEKMDIDLFVNNAGFGDIGHFDKTSLKKEIDMVKVNDIATLILVKNFLIRFDKKKKGRILITASAASFGVAPYMNVYYASKAFVYSLAHGYYRELKDRKSPVSISVLCPGPIKTRFEKTGNMDFNFRTYSSKRVANYAVKRFLKGKFEIVPGLKMKAGHLFSHFVPKRFISFFLNKQAEIKSEEAR